jgi:hypothetical protein
MQRKRAMEKAYRHGRARYKRAQKVDPLLPVAAAKTKPC